MGTSIYQCYCERCVHFWLTRRKKQQGSEQLQTACGYHSHAVFSSYGLYDGWPNAIKRLYNNMLLFLRHWPHCSVHCTLGKPWLFIHKLWSITNRTSEALRASFMTRNNEWIKTTKHFYTFPFIVYTETFIILFHSSERIRCRFNSFWSAKRLSSRVKSFVRGLSLAASPCLSTVCNKADLFWVCFYHSGAQNVLDSRLENLGAWMFVTWKVSKKWLTLSEYKLYRNRNANIPLW